MGEPTTTQLLAMLDEFFAHHNDALYQTWREIKSKSLPVPSPPHKYAGFVEIVHAEDGGWDARSPLHYLAGHWRSRDKKGDKIGCYSTRHEVSDRLSYAPPPPGYDEWLAEQEKAKNAAPVLAPIDAEILAQKNARIATLEAQLAAFRAAGLANDDGTPIVKGVLGKPLVTKDGYLLCEPRPIAWWDGDTLRMGAGCLTEYLVFCDPNDESVEFAPNCGLAGCYSSREAALAAKGAEKK